ncbi:hypothetical protein N1851_007756 [Merluccius polli]|uniref:Uncharacterized protein n=1 Tax=Merluccius polli TaxID=89951 RepID=A0AA47N3P7_MERPO|nr:hypothetical protein N1851_007756 [Merluccius polli]
MVLRFGRATASTASSPRTPPAIGCSVRRGVMSHDSSDFVLTCAPCEKLLTSMSEVRKRKQDSREQAESTSTKIATTVKTNGWRHGHWCRVSSLTQPQSLISQTQARLYTQQRGRVSLSDIDEWRGDDHHLLIRPLGSCRKPWVSSMSGRLQEALGLLHVWMVAGSPGSPPCLDGCRKPWVSSMSGRLQEALGLLHVWTVAGSPGSPPCLDGCRKPWVSSMSAGDIWGIPMKSWETRGSVTTLKVNVPSPPPVTLCSSSNQGVMTLWVSALVSLLSLLGGYAKVYYGGVSEGKSRLINNFIIENTFDFMFVTETWLNQNNSGVVLVESIPPNFNIMSEIRVGKQGGGVMSEVRISQKGGGVMSEGRKSFGKFASFEYLALILKPASCVLLLTIYRPPKYSANFFDEFTEFSLNVSPLSVILIFILITPTTAVRSNFIMDNL